MKTFKILLVLFSFFFSQSLVGQTNWDWLGANFNFSAYDLIIESEDSIYAIGIDYRWNSDLNIGEAYSMIQFSSDGGENWKTVLKIDSSSRFIAFGG